MIFVDCPRCHFENAFEKQYIIDLDFWVLCGLCEREFDVTESIDEYMSGYSL